MPPSSTISDDDGTELGIGYSVNYFIALTPPPPYRSVGRAVTPIGVVFLSATHDDMILRYADCTVDVGWLVTLAIPLRCRGLRS